MKIYILKHKGKNSWDNLMCGGTYIVEIGKNKFYAGMYFYRRKDAKAYKKLHDKYDFTEIKGCEVPYSKEDI